MKYGLPQGETVANTISNKNDSNNDRALMIHRDYEYSKETISGWIALVAIILVFIVILFVIGLHYQDKLPICFYILCPECRP